ncbi:MAG: hypothetical protein UT14_C0002G0018 [Candidatus Shapirobacteria bacterium GW2011_GWE1_38_92]|uniref:Glycosyl transferase family 1 domain-containing protein n=3 Tax=Candidatus Shapironibacteriota TaxID=1752721 RepID=A0A0G0JXV8_9BACT|nr:MAG: hypothetical protein US90_C0003G0015 [Candidatus Shapirobacteria bacterium GW2011_GWE2_38_30]KKQ92834.1 MAG: hypothetical protein UT14_C0002G0018 [Candidatus Shapirobacteria bacterium GW2011_GWE1_38_92]OGL56315.1 MAG: hypothetical protein A2367_03385 [Candidatus Shapirobacteria bacterium RIFOXYB1_FULL_38_38]
MNNLVLLAEFGRFGGTRTYFIQLVKLYIKKDIKVTVLLRKDQLDRDILVLLKENDVEIHIRPNFKVIGQTFPGYIFLYFLEFFYWKIRFVTSKLTVVLSGVGYFEYLASLIIFNRSLFVVHSYPVGKIRYISYLSKYLINKNKYILTVSNYSKEKIVENFSIRDSSLVQVINNTCDYGGERDNKISLNKNIVTFGHLEKYKNPEYWLKVAEEVCKIDKDVSFAWFGEGSWEEIIKLKIIKGGLGKRIKLFKFVNNPREVLCDSYLYFQPSLVESFGLSVLEAMSLGIPSVVSNEGGLPELVKDNVNGLVFDNFDVSNTANTIMKIVNDEKFRNRLSSNCMEIYKNKYSPNIWEEKMFKLHQTIC